MSNISKKSFLISFGVFFSALLIVFLTMIFINFSIPDNLYYPERSYNVFSPVNFSQEFFESQGNRLDAIWIENPTSSEVIFYLHGNSGRIPDLLPLLSSRYNVMSIAYPGYHHSEGSPNKDSINQAAVDGYEYLKTQFGFADEDIIIYGHSMGGSPATYLAARKDQAQKLVLVNTFASVKDMCSLRYGLLCSLVWNHFDATKEARKVKIPVRQYHLVRDPVVPIEQGRKLFENFENTNDKDFIELESGVHSVFDVNKTLR